MSIYNKTVLIAIIDYQILAIDYFIQIPLAMHFQIMVIVYSKLVINYFDHTRIIFQLQFDIINYEFLVIGHLACNVSNLLLECCCN